MQRKILIAMMLGAVLAAEGCRPERKTQPPISVEKESDFLYTRKSDIIGVGLEPKPKPETITKTPEQQKAEQADAEKKRKEEEKIAADERSKANAALGDWLLKYRNSNAPTLYSFEKVRTALRRQGKTVMYNDVDRGNIDVVYLCDPYNSGDIICYHKTVETEDDPTGKKTIEKGHPTFFANNTAGYIKKDDIGRRLREQELRVCWYYGVVFVTPAFYRTSPEFGAYAPLNQIPQPPPNPPIPMGPPPLFLSRVKARNQEKNPPDKLSFSRFKKHLSETAPPRLLKLIEDNKFCVNVDADLSLQAEWFACRVEPESKDKDSREKVNAVIDASGNIGYFAPELTNLWVAKNQPKK